MQTSITPSPNSAEPIALLPSPTRTNPITDHQLPITIPPPLKPRAPIAAKSIIGKVDFRTPAEEAEFRECEKIIREGWGPFTRVGEALATIRDKKLYKNEHASFEAYCQERWGFGRAQACHYIAAAQVHKSLATVPGLPLPECEAQIRPLVGLSDELAQQAWLKALSWTREGYVMPRLVRRAAKQVVRAEQPAVAAQSNVANKQRSRLRQSVRTGFQELLTLIFQNAQREVLTAKVQEIQRLLDPLLAPKKTKV